MTESTCLVIMYHYVRNSDSTPFPALRALPVEHFERQLDWLEREYRLIALEQLEAALDGRSALPPDAALLTFDDGFSDHYAQVLPVLRRRGLSGVFFLTSEVYADQPRVLGVHKTHFLLARLGAEALARAVFEESGQSPTSLARQRVAVFGSDRWEYADERALKNLLNYELPIEDSERILDELFERHVGRPQEFARDLYLSESMVRKMAVAGMQFGYHSRSHRMLSRLGTEQQEVELRDGVSWVQSLSRQARVPFCYPWGGRGTYTNETIHLLRDHGYSLAFNTERRRVAMGRDDRFELPRVDTRDLPPYTTGQPVAAPRSVTEHA